MKQIGLDDRHAPLYEEPVSVIDLWKLFATGRLGPDIGILGESNPDAIRAWLGDAPDEDTDEYEPGWYLRYGELGFSFNDDRHLQGVYFGGSPNEVLPLGVDFAAAGFNAFGEANKPSDIWISGDTVVRFDGAPGSSFATLPNFIGLFPKHVPVRYAAMPMRKSISMKAQTHSLQLKAEFILKAFKFDYSEPFCIDYCLHTLSVADRSISIFEDDLAPYIPGAPPS